VVKGPVICDSAFTYAHDRNSRCLLELFSQSYTGDFMDKKYLAIAGVAAAAAAIGIGLLMKTKKEEKHGWHW
jgi:hypothetical protein